MERFLSPEATLRLLGLAKSPYHPKVIVDLKNEIEAETRAGELAFSIEKVVDEKCIEKIVQMKLQLDALYGAWAEGKIS